MEIPYYIFLYIYFGLVAVFLLFSFFNIFHIFRYGFFNFATLFMMVLFLTVTVLIIYFTREQINLIDWKDTFDINLPSISF